MDFSTINAGVVGKLYLFSCPKYITEFSEKSAEEIGQMIIDAVSEFYSLGKPKLNKVIEKGCAEVKAFTVSLDSRPLDSWSDYSLKHSFRDFAGDMFSLDKYEVFKKLFGISPQDYRKNCLDKCFTQFKKDIDVLVYYNLGSVRVMDLPNCVCKPILEYDCTFDEFVMVIDEELESGDYQFSHFISVFTYIRNIVEFIDFVHSI